MLRKSKLPDAKWRNDDPTTGLTTAAQVLTTANVEYVVNGLGIRLRFNMMTRRVEMECADFAADPPAVNARKTKQALRDALMKLDVRNQSGLEEVLIVLAERDAYHPMEEWIDSRPWDGVDRLPELVASVPAENEMWPVYLRKWLIQTCQAVFGWHEGVPQSLPHVLVFSGSQGIGKGRWVRQLAPGFTLADADLHLSGPKANDHQIQVLRWPIVELGEIDSTFKKSDQSLLKSFLSRSTDELREVYRHDAFQAIRATCFLGTVNDLQFLVDATGSRRYWPVEVTHKINWDHGVDMQQLWAQMAVEWEQGVDWNLTELEDARREEEAQGFTMVVPEAERLDGHWHKHRANLTQYAVLNKTEIMDVVGIKTTSMATVASVTNWLITNMGKPRKMKGKFRSWLWPCPPTHAVRGLIYVDEDYVKANLKVATSHLTLLPGGKSSRVEDKKEGSEKGAPNDED